MAEVVPSDEALKLNERSLQALMRSLTLSQGQFSLILVRCNYSRLRDEILQQIQTSSELNIQKLELPEFTPTLFTCIQAHLEALKDNPPKELPAALMVVGLEKVQQLDAVFGSANLIRDEFRKKLPFPLVLWGNDHVLRQLAQSAPDFRSWAAAPIRFQFPIEELVTSLRHHAHQIFITLLSTGAEGFLPNAALNLQSGSPLRTELEFAIADILNSGRTLDPELQASLDFLGGRDAHARAEMETARTYYENSLTFWREGSTIITDIESDENGEQLGTVPLRSLIPHTPTSYILKEAILLFHLGLWWRSYAVLQRATYEASCRRAKDYFSQCLNLFRLEGRLELVAKFITALQETLQKLRQWEELETLTSEAMELHQTFSDPVRLARDHGFWAELMLARSDWAEAHECAETALEILDEAPPEEAKDIPTAPPAASSTVTAAQPQRVNKPPLLDDSLAIAEHYQRGWYLLLLGRSQSHLGDVDGAIASLKSAQTVSDPQHDPILYIQILQELRDLCFAQGNYLEAFRIKQAQRRVEQQYGFRAFAGAGRLEPQRSLLPSEVAPSSPEAIVAQEIAASSRQQDVDRLVDRISTPKDKLTVIHGPSGVGKSSIVTAGLFPTLQRRTIEARRVVPVLLSVYTGWEETLERYLMEALEAIGYNREAIGSDFDLVKNDSEAVGNDSEAIRNASETVGNDSETVGNDSEAVGNGSGTTSNQKNSLLWLLDQLRQNQNRNLFTVLIFDQFEEFFFVRPDPLQRKSFYLFLRDCLNIPYVKVILSLREDYLHYLLEIDRVADLEVINNDILSREIRYPLGDFSPADARAVIENLTERSQFYLDADLVDALVHDLTGALDGIRPIELQIVGAQLQEDRIDTLVEYQQLGEHPKQTLVQRYLQEIIRDCGKPNEAIAQLILFLLTDENGTRPLKTRLEISEELELTGITVSPEQLDLVLEIMVGSGLVLSVPELPGDRYQLVHDYLVSYIRQQQEHGLLAELEAEREKRRLSEAQLREALREKEQALFKEQQERQRAEIAEIEALGAASRALLLSHNQLDALLTSIKAATRLQKSEVPFNLKTRIVGQLWQAVYTIHELNRLEHPARVSSISFSPDGTMLVSGGEDNVIKLWNLNGEELNSFRCNQTWVRSISFSPDSRMIAFGGEDNTIRLWNLDGEELRSFQGHRGRVRSISFSPDGTMIASGSEDNTLKLWSISGKQLKSFQAHDRAVLSISFSPDGATLASGGGDNLVRLWSLDGEELKSFRGHLGRVRSISFSPDGTMLASGAEDSLVKLWSLDGQELQSFQEHSWRVLSVSFSPDGKMIASGGGDGTIKIWNLNGQELDSFQAHQGWVLTISFSPDGKTLASGGGDNAIKLWHLQGHKPQRLQGHYGRVRSVTFSPDGSMIASGGGDSIIRLWNLKGEELQTLKGHQGRILSVSFSPDGKRVASSSEDSTIKLWSVEGEGLQTLLGHYKGVSSTHFSPDGRLLASGGGDGTVKLWSLEGEELQSFQGHEGKVLSVSFSPNNKLIASAGEDSTIKLWDLAGEELQRLSGSRGKVWSISFSPNSRMIASGGGDGTVKLWSLDGEELQSFQGHRGNVWSVSFSPDGQLLASGGGDGTVKLWSLDGEELQSFQGHRGNVWNVSFNPDGQSIVSSGEDNSVILWNWDLDTLLKDGCNWLRGYLQTNSKLNEEDRLLCDR
jgi:WD40 repeat protein/tetratricopeptide (TPR) repeat protein